MSHSGLRLALLDASEESSTPRNFRRELDADLVEYDAAGGELPSVDAVDAFDGAVITGSRASVYWDEPWIDALREWVAAAHERGLPMFGVCYGHQLLAAALGGEVADMGDFELGYREVEHDGGRLFEGVDERFTAFTTHGDEVVELPPGAEALAANDYSLHAFRAGRAFGVQFHPEYDVETAETVASEKDDELSADRFAAALDSITAENYRAACEAKQVFRNFTAFVEEVRDGQTDGDASGAPATA